VLVLLLMFVFMISYTATGSPLGFLMLSYVMLWKNARAKRQEAAAAGPAAELARLVPGPARGAAIRMQAREPGS